MRINLKSQKKIKKSNKKNKKARSKEWEKKLRQSRSKDKKKMKKSNDCFSCIWRHYLIYYFRKIVNKKYFF